MSGGGLLPILWVLAKRKRRSLRWEDRRLLGEDSRKGVMEVLEELTKFEEAFANDVAKGV